MRKLAAALLSALCLAAAGCGDSGGASAPAACEEGERAYLTALRAAPGAVRLAGETPISDCLVANQASGELETVGAAMVGAATTLNARSRSDSPGRAALQLGYLVGAAERGDEETAGIHTDLILRLRSAAGFSPRGNPLPAGFASRYRRGLRAGLADG